MSTELNNEELIDFPPSQPSPPAKPKESKKSLPRSTRPDVPMAPDHIPSQFLFHNWLKRKELERKADPALWG